ncbi:MAG TPA: glycosyltransferase family 4 protein [Candidatus Paceibacterota bacterium]|nr:glycosyltransferase family 4 protein [Candidatus Paceibacterota bacterium]
MNLLMISGDRSLAAGKHGAFFNTIEGLHKHFDRIDIICPKIAVHRYNMQMFGNVFIHPSPWPLLLQPLWIRHIGKRLVRQFGHQIATCHEYPPFYNGIGARLLHRAVGISYILEVMHVPGLPRAAGIRERLYCQLTRSLIAWDARPAVAVRVINEHQTPDFLMTAGVPRNKLIYAPAFYIDLDIFKPMALPKRYDLAFVGRMATNKGIGLFLDVLERTGLIGVAVGDGPLLSWVRDQAKRRRLKLHTPGFVQASADVARYMNESRLLLMTALNEGGPRVVLESAACGVPVVATPVGIVPDIFPPEAIEDWDADALADKVRNILSDSPLYDRLRQFGSHVASNFERSTVLAMYIAMLKKMHNSTSGDHA